MSIAEQLNVNRMHVHKGQKRIVPDKTFRFAVSRKQKQKINGRECATLSINNLTSISLLEAYFTVVVLLK